MTVDLVGNLDCSVPLKRFAYALKDPSGLGDWNGFVPEFKSLTNDERVAVIAALGEDTILAFIRLAAGVDSIDTVEGSFENASRR